MNISKYLVAGLALLGVSASAAAEVPIEELARYPAMSGLSMSPDGDFIVGLMVPPGNPGDDRGIAVWDLTNPGSAPTFTPSNDRMKFVGATALRGGKIQVRASQAWTGIAWCLESSSNTGSTKTFVSKTYMTDTDMEDFDEPFLRAGSRESVCDNQGTQAGIVAMLPFEEDTALINRRSRDGQFGEYAVFNLKTGSSRQIFRENAEDAAGLWDLRNVRLLTKERLDVANGEYYFSTLILNEETGNFDQHEKLTWTAGARHKIDVVGYDEATGKYYVVTDQFADMTELYFYDPKTREYDPEPLFSLPDFPVGGIILGNRVNNYNQLLGVWYRGADQEIYWVSDDFYNVHEGLKAAFPGKSISIVDYTDDLNRILFTVSSSASPVVYYLLENKTDTRLIGATRPWLDTDEMSEMNLVYYTARDGLQIPALLALPAGWEEGDDPAPAIVMPHGGPWSRDYAGAYRGGDNWVHFFTSRGYAVLKPQYRGSDDFGRNLWLSGDGEWGQKMQDDKDDGAAWLVEQGIADPDRIGIMGFSYGGFAAMAATVREDGPFKCAIAGAGVSNLERLGNLWGGNRIQRRIQGRTVDGMDPMENTDTANIPILIYHGDRDTRVELYHSVDFYNAIKDRVPSELVVVKDMPHGMPWPEHFQESFEAMDHFLTDVCEL